MNLPQLADRNPRIDLRGREVRVPEQRLDEANVRAVLQHVRGTRVAEGMARARNGDSREAEVSLHEIAQPVAAGSSTP